MSNPIASDKPVTLYFHMPCWEIIIMSSSESLVCEQNLE
jgi:hypothetical protein